MSAPLGPGRAATPPRWDLANLETTLSPEEFVRQGEATPCEGGTPLDQLLRTSATLTFLLGESFIQPYRRHEIVDGATLFQGGGLEAGGMGAGRSLLVGLCGRADRLMLPLPIILQHLPAARWDVLLLRDRRRFCYRRGAGDFGSSLPAMGRRVAALAEGYRRWVAFGTSMGGVPAARLALLAGAERGVSIGGRRAVDTLWLRSIAPLDPFDDLCACLPKFERNLVFAHAADCNEDAEAAAALTAIAGGRHMPVEGYDGHGLLHPLFVDGALPEFLETVLEGPVTSIGRFRAAARAAA